MLADFLLESNPLFPNDLHVFLVLLAMGCSGASLLFLVFKHNWRVTLTLFGMAFAFPLGVALFSDLPLLLRILANHPEITILTTTTIIVGLLAWLQYQYDLFRLLNLFWQPFVGAIEVTEIPRNYYEPSSAFGFHPQAKTPPLQRMQRVIRTLCTAQVPIGFRLERFNTRTRLYFTTWAADPDTLTAQLNQLQQALKAQFPTFTFHTHRLLPTSHLPENTQGSAACLTGVPTQSNPIFSQPVEPLTVIAEMMQQTHTYGIIQLFATPTQAKGLLHALREQRSRQQLKSANQQGLLPSEIKQLQRRIERLQHKDVCRVQVTASFWNTSTATAKDKAVAILQAIKGTLSPEDKHTDFDIRTYPTFLEQKAFQRLLQGYPVGKSTTLNPKETAPYFVPPRCDLGIQVIDQPTYYTATPKPISSPMTERSTLQSGHPKERLGEVLVGQLLRSGKPIDENLLIPRDMWGMHVGIWGQTGAGKTTTARNLIAQLNLCGVTPIILVPEKVKDWRPILDVIKDLRIFTAGNEQVAPLRLNPFHVPDGVPLNRHISSIVDIFVATWPNEGILKNYIEKIIEETYTRADWDRATNTSGRPILLHDLHNAMQAVFDRDLQYSDRLRQDFWGALNGRITTLLTNPVLAHMYNTPTGLTIPELLQHPTIIEMGDLSAEQRAFLTSLITVGIANYLEAQSRLKEHHDETVRYALVFEEAHHFLRNYGGGPGIAEGHSIRQEAINQIANILRQIRGHGCAVFILNQLPSTVAPEAVKIPGITIIHALKDQHERHLVGRQANCTKPQLRHIGGMKPGEAVIHLPGQPEPYNIQVTPILTLYRQTKEFKTWTDPALNAHMQTLYEQHPHLATTYPIDNLTMKAPTSPLPNPFTQLDTTITMDIHRAVRHPQFQAQLHHHLTTAQLGNLTPLLTYLHKVIIRRVLNPTYQEHYLRYLISLLQKQSSQASFSPIYDQLQFALTDTLTDTLTHKEVTNPA